MKYGSVCSGIEAASVAWHNLGWEPQWFSEIEQFPSDVLKHRFPTVPNLGDMTTINQNPIADERPIDLLVGGTPCQSFSVAGLRKGLDDPRGNLMLTFLSIADKLRPKWIVWENVPGVLSSNGGKDFGTFLGALGELGYGFAYRVLDAQHFGVAQRRRRVFVVGYLGDWRVAAAVLFERESLQGNTKPSRKKREEVTANAEGSVGDAGSWWDGSQVAGTLTKQNANGAQRMPDKDNFGAILQQPFRKVRRAQSDSDFETWEKDETANTINCFDVGDVRSTNVVAQPIAIQDVRPIEKAQNGRGWNDDGTSYTVDTKATQGVAQPIAYSFDALSSNSMKSSNPNSGCRAVDVAKTLDTATPEPSKNQGGIAIAQPIAIAENTIGRQPMNGGNGDGFTEDGPMYTLNATGVHGVAQPIAFDTFNQTTSNINQTIKSPQGGVNESIGVVAQPIVVDWRTAQVDQGITQTLKTDLAKMSGPCIAVDTYNYTTNNHTTQTIRSQSDTEHIGAVLQPIAVDVYNQSIDGQTSATITEAVGGTNTSGPKVMHSMDFRKSFYEIKKDVLVRKYPVDTDSLKRCLKKHKKISNNKISELLNLPKTKIEHWFRQDDSFAIPSAEHWFQLKEILHIETNIFDQSITEFIIEENKYDSTNRIYDSTFPSPTLTASNSGSDNYITHMAIRRLTPKECERLQGFPDDWTKIPYRNKPSDQCPDGPRYKACGNSMAVPVMRWIGQRIQYVENLMKEL
jgi:DNA-cytosine methyltransferase